MQTLLELKIPNFSLCNPVKRPDYLKFSEVEVFKTNIHNETEAVHLRCMLLQFFPHYDIHFDLEDCDKILRIENPKGRVEAAFIMDIFRAKEYRIEILN